MLRAIDTLAAERGTTREVVIKAMMNKDQFIREILQRGDLDGEFVVPVNCSSNDFGPIQKKWSPGKITRDHGDGTYDVEYDDGHEERQVKAEHIETDELRVGDKVEHRRDKATITSVRPRQRDVHQLDFFY